MAPQSRVQIENQLDAAIMRGLADIDAGRICDADQAFDELDAELAVFEANAVSKDDRP